jgi:hypothetical protein
VQGVGEAVDGAPDVPDPPDDPAGAAEVAAAEGVGAVVGALAPVPTPDPPAGVARESVAGLDPVLVPGSGLAAGLAVTGGTVTESAWPPAAAAVGAGPAAAPPGPATPPPLPAGEIPDGAVPEPEPAARTVTP